MPSIPRDVIDALRERATLEDVVSGYFPLKSAGQYLKALCPFHDEKSASFVVSPSRQIYKCFGCGEGGDVFDFVMKMDHLEFMEAVEMLAERFGVTLVRDERGQEGPSRRDLLRVLSWAQGVFRKGFASPTAAACRDYVAKRGFTAATVEAFGFGFSRPDGRALRELAFQRKIPAALLEKAGLARPRARTGDLGDVFWDARLMFPIRDPQGHVVAFGARTLDGSEPKYLNSPESQLFHKGKLLFGLDRLRTTRHRGRVFVVEGYTDVMMAVQSGVEGVVATLGTALTPDHARLLARHTDEVVLLYDGDAAGLAAAERGAQILVQEGHVDLSVAVLPKGQDPCDYFAARGPEGVAELAETTEGLLEFLIARARARNGTDAAGTNNTAKDMVQVLAAVKDGMVRQVLSDRVAAALRLPPHRVEEAVSARHRGDRRRPEATKKAVAQKERRGPDRAVRRIVQSILNAPELASRLSDDDLLLIENEKTREFLRAVREERLSGDGATAQVLDLGGQAGLREHLRPLILTEDHEHDLAGRLEEALTQLDNKRREAEAHSLRERIATRDDDGMLLSKLQETYRSLKGRSRGTSVSTGRTGGDSQGDGPEHDG